MRFSAAAVDAFRAVKRPTAGLVFVSGALAERITDVAEALQRAELGMPVVIASGAGVLSERGELERLSAGTGLAFHGGKPEVLAVSGATADQTVSALARAVTAPGGARGATALVFTQASGFTADSLEPLIGATGTHIVGAGTPGDAPLFALGPDGTLVRGTAAALVTRGLTPARVRSSPACRLLTQLRPITAARGPLLLEIGGEPALDVLQTAATELQGQPLILTVLAPPPDDEETARPELLVRGIQGVDPARRAILLSGDLEVGSRMAFAVRDATAARADLELVTRELAREAAGAAPLFGVYIDCASRGSELYATPDVDVRVLRARFPDVPLVGLQSAFEIAPYAGRAAVHFYTGVLALFTAPS